MAGVLGKGGSKGVDGAARHRRHAREQRGGGVPTVVQLGPALSLSSQIPPRLHTLRALTSKVLIGHEPVIALEKLADSWLLSCPSSSTFGEECELVSALLYIGITVPDSFTCLLPRDVVFTFLERWLEDGGWTEFPKLISGLKPEWKCGAAQVMFLLCGNLLPDDWSRAVLQTDISAWTCEWLPDIPPPSWILNGLDSSGDLSQFITLLRVSASLLQGISIPLIELQDSYIGTLTKFLCAVDQYQRGEYSSGLALLEKIGYVTSERKMQAWVSHLGGLMLAKTGKPHAALIKLQEAVGRSPSGIPALYNMAHVFHSLDQQRGELEVLELLVKSGDEEAEDHQASLHVSVLTLHHRLPEDFTSRAQYFLSCRYLQEKRSMEAAESLEVLYDRAIQSGESSVVTQRCLLRPEDTVAALPAPRVLMVLAATARASADCYKETLKILDGKLMEEGVGGSTFYQDRPEERMQVVTVWVGKVLRAEALKRLNQDTESLKECIRMEQAMWWVRGVGNDSSASPWDIIILQVKTCMYKMLSDLHEGKDSLQNHHHYTRLAKQCLDALARHQTDATWQDVSPSNQLALDCFNEYLKSQLNGVLP